MSYRKKWLITALFFILLANALANSIDINHWNDSSKSGVNPPSFPKSAQGGTITSGEVVMGTTDGYNWWSYVPESLAKSNTAYILLEMSHAQEENYTLNTDSARQNVEQWITLAEFKKYIIVTAAIPRNLSSGYYPQGINVHSLDPSTPEFYYRPDLKVNNIISELMTNLTDAGYTLCEKILVAGFSAGGMWANRYTLLHPERVLAAAMGQAGGWLAMPLSEYNGSLLNWPMGLNNFDTLTGASYNKTDLLKEVPQLIFIGDLDTSSTYCGEGYPYCANITVWGMSDPERLEAQYNYLNEHNYNVKFKLYEGYGHTYNIFIKNDVLDFFDTVIKSEFTGTISSYDRYILSPIILVAVISLALFHRKRAKFSQTLKE